MAIWTVRAVFVFIIASFIFAAIALLAPTWYREGPFDTIGLFAKCDDYKGCEWAHEELFKWERILPVWYVVCQVLMCCAVFTVFVNLIICFQWNLHGEISKITHCVNAVFMVFAFIELFSTVIHYGVNAYKERGVIVTNNRAAFRAFDWAYLLACLATLCQFIAVVMLILHVHKEKKLAKKDAQYAASIGTGYPLMYQ